MPMETEGFQPEDRKTLTTIEVEVRHIFEELRTFSARITKLEHDHVRRSDFQELQVDIDDLRANKADRSESVGKDIAHLRHEIENLQRWRWFERGAVLAIIAAAELLMRVIGVAR